MPVIPVEWHDNVHLTSIQKESNAFLFRTKVQNKAVTFAVTFPAVGGVRLTAVNVEKGFFDCSDNGAITYSGKKYLKLTSGNRTAVFCKDDACGFMLHIQNADGETVYTFTGADILFGLSGNKLKKFAKMKLCGDFTNDEVLYGLGERYNTLNQVGHDALMWNVDTAIHGGGRDNGVDHNETYQCVPVLHSNRGYMLFVNSMYGAWFDFGKKTPHRFSLDFNGPVADFFVFAGTPKENLKSYTDLTGHSIIPPKWAFQYWMGGGAPAWQVDNRDFKDVLQEYIDGYAAMGIHHVAACYGEGGPSKNKEGYEIAAKSGMRMLIWNHPSQGIEFAKKVLGTDDMNELPFLMPKGRKKTCLAINCTNWLDFTHPNAKKVLRAFYKEYFSWGLKGAMIDFGEFVTPDALLYNGKPGNAMHNEHSYWYAKTMKEVFDEGANGDYILFQRSGCAGSQAFAGQFGGDQAAFMYGLKQAFYAGVNMGASGFNIWGSDIGGYNGSTDDETYKRWLEFATFSPLMRAHGVGNPRNPWVHGDEAVELFKKLYWWRENMLDYVYSSAVNAHLTAEPMMRAMAIEFPRQGLDHVDTQYMFGSELLVAPVIDLGRRCKMVHFPAGNWFNLWTAEKIAGDRQMMVEANDADIPVYLRAGAAMVLRMSDTLELTAPFEAEKAISALLVTPADKKRTVRHYFDEKTFADFVTDNANGAAVTVKNVSGAKLSAVLALGVEAKKVLVDGKEAAFTAENGKTVVRTDKGFKTVEIF